MATAETSRSVLWNPQRRTFTAGLVLVITLVAFEAMGLGTALPTIVAEFGAQHWYSWPFTVFLAASAIGTVIGGRLSDRRGPAVPLLLALPTFAVGLLVAGFAMNMLVLLVARVLQGLAGGVLIVALYVMIARVFPEEHRPAAFGALSSAWVVPALVGPVVSGALTEQASWRWVFLGLAPLVCIGAAMLVPTARRFGARSADPPAPRPGLPLAAVGAAGGVVALNWAAQDPSLTSLLIGLAGVAALVPSLRLLLPEGTLRARPGIPRMVLSRGLLSGFFFTAQAFVPLALTVVHHYSPTTAGVPLTVGSVGWTAGALWQSRQRELRRERVVAAGFALVGVGIAGLALSLPAWGPHGLVFACWFVAGCGMGIGVTSTSVRVLSLSAEGERGFNSAALQISDMLGQAALVGLGGVVVAALATPASPAGGVAPLDLALLAAALLAALALVRATRNRTS
ncbi:Predicted arabinose efflux permease, MFS family [Saccharopolyspora kobensis]|uniref:Predicted arabinose efflux permease, MFS family n=2 Tax=Saccharopolyspora kobensis TaxID=146035 RepID=A0A1H6BJY1_9PSEU|nr:MFS transporter [Saccharopolyspora kobensis]SEG61003.1 Predicted arabinose efflux permease, MFS family [Saccharopolyspora kobensis]SFE87695.1 Predicted arabinose efflux permease, MFS family [Saccharopolyspora kobensis]